MKGQGQAWKQGHQQSGCPSVQHLLGESPLCWLWGGQEDSAWAEESDRQTEKQERETGMMRDKARSTQSGERHLPREEETRRASLWRRLLADF